MKLFAKLNTKKGFRIFANFFLLFKLDVRKQDENELDLQSIFASY